MEPLGSPPTQPGSPAHIEEPALRTVASLADLPLRRGKWTPEEQNFSEVLIQAFLAGLVPDCADGTTLRAFLSRRLHCAPMRITKKFAGATLGKSIFSRTGQLDAGDAANLRRLESLFVRAEETNSAEAVFLRCVGGLTATARRRPGGPRGPPGAPEGLMLCGPLRKMRWLGAARCGGRAVRAGRVSKPPHSTSTSSLSSLAPGASASSQHSWAARVAECAAQTTAARRDAELRAARATFGDSEPRSVLPPPSIDESPRTSLMRSLDSISAASAPPPRRTPLMMQAPPRPPRGPGYDKSLGAGLAARDLHAAAAARSAAVGRSGQSRDGLYGELYGWVPRDLGVNKSPATLARVLGCPEPPRGPPRPALPPAPAADADRDRAAPAPAADAAPAPARARAPAPAPGPACLSGPPGLSHKRAASPGRLVVQDDAKAARQAGHPSPRRADPMGASPLFGLSYRKSMVGPPPPPGPAPAPATETVAARSSTTVPLRP